MAENGKGNYPCKGIDIGIYIQLLKMSLSH